MMTFLTRFVEWIGTITREDLYYWGYLTIVGIGTVFLWALAAAVIFGIGVLIWKIWPIVAFTGACVCAGLVISVKMNTRGSIWSKKDGYDAFRKL